MVRMMEAGVRGVEWGTGVRVIVCGTSDRQVDDVCCRETR